MVAAAIALHTGQNVDLISLLLSSLILPDSFLDSEATISGDPLTNTSIF